MELLSKSDKMHLTAGQTSALATFYNQCINSLASSIEVAFTPTQEWIDKFAAVNYFFYNSGETPEGRLLYNIRQGKISEGKAQEPSWIPQNGELIEASFRTDPKDTDFFRCIYVGFDGKYHVVFYDREAEHESTDRRQETPMEQRAYEAVLSMRHKPKKTQVPLAELLSVYASVKGLTQDGVELKPEN
ncbi:MAG TPA: hypothetical protein VN038_01380 [Dyadobacter sp.]|nr:hypothetical protein [Dyadobacter sp.]